MKGQDRSLSRERLHTAIYACGPLCDVTSAALGLCLVENRYTLPLSLTLLSPWGEVCAVGEKISMHRAARVGGVSALRGLDSRRSAYRSCSPHPYPPHYEHVSAGLSFPGTCTVG